MSAALLASRLTAALVAYFAGRPESAAEPGYPERIAVIAAQQVAACEAEPIPGFDLAQCSAAVATIAKWESALREDVHAGRRWGPGAARCFMQLEPSIHQVPTVFHHSSSVTRHRATGVLGWHAFRCGIRAEEQGGPERLMAEYHRATPFCDAPVTQMARWRAGSYRALVARLGGQ